MGAIICIATANAMQINFEDDETREGLLNLESSRIVWVYRNMRCCLFCLAEAKESKDDAALAWAFSI